MSWYAKIASVTFSPSGSERISQPVIMHGLGYDVMDFAYKNGFRNIFVEPDGGHEFNSTGIMNFYLLTSDQNNNPLPASERPTTQDVINLVKAFVTDRAGVFEMEPVRVDTSQSRPDTRVVRVNVTKNETQSYSKIPEMNISNDNAKVLINLLNAVGLNVEYDYGSFSADDYKRVRPLISEKLKELFARETTKEEADDVPTIIDFGLDPERLERYLQGLDQMVAWMDSSQVPEHIISYG